MASGRTLVHLRFPHRSILFGNSTRNTETKFAMAIEVIREQEREMKWRYVVVPLDIVFRKRVRQQSSQANKQSYRSL